ncbi:MAG: SLBB domain-containing protein [Nitrospirota bacterium]|nr:SLBB domain-containing protein [Nitrospirota bacterium]
MHTATSPAEPLLTRLHRLRRDPGGLSPEALGRMARECHLTDAELTDFVSFFPALTRPADTRRVCTGPACRLAGAQTDGDASFCLGYCEQAPFTLHGEPPVAVEMDEPLDWLARFDQADAVAGLLDEIDASGLTGMGGAAFPTGKKLAAVRDRPELQKYVIANGDEGEPATFKDRWLLERHPDTVLAGVLLACRITGASRAILYLRHEYPGARRRMARAIQKATVAGWIHTETPDPHHPAVTVVEAGGPYICGEETALIASLEGRRGHPAPGPPYPAQSGLNKKPTLVQNVETLFYIARIAERGGSAWGDGKRHISISGPVARPGVVELPRGITARQVLAAAGGITGGRAVAAFIPGGGASGLLPPAALDVPLTNADLAEWGTGAGTGGVVFLPEGACVVDMAAHLATFYAREACGQCDPCRRGTAFQAAQLTALTRGAPLDVNALSATAGAMRLLSICGLGRWAPVVVETLLRHFPDAVASHAAGTCPAGVCH